MSRKLFAISFVLLLAVAIVPTAFADEGDEVSIEGEVTDITDTTFTVTDEDGNDETFLLPDDLEFTISEGDVLEVKGTEGAEGEPNVATSIENPDTGDEYTAEGDGETDGDDASVFEHPVVFRIAMETGATYDEIWELFREGNDGGVVGLGRIKASIRFHNMLGDQFAEFEDWQDMLEWHLEGGNGWGALVVASKLAERFPDADAGDLLAMHDDEGMNWGQIQRTLRGIGGGPPAALGINGNGNGNGNRPPHAGPPDSSD